MVYDGEKRIMVLPDSESTVEFIHPCDFSKIQRALGIIEGVSCALENPHSELIYNAIEMIDVELAKIGGCDNGRTQNAI